MKRLWFCTLLAVFMTTPAYAEEVGATYKDFNNGCGSGANEKLVPDQILGIDIRQACANHDNCYSKCLEGGENYGKEICKKDNEKEDRRAICDQRFKEEIEEICKKISMFDLGKKQLCTLISDIYPIAVRVGGKPSFNGIQVSNKMLVYLQNNQLEDKDIEKLGQEINSLSRIDGIQENTMILSVKNGKPVASLEGIPSEVPAKSDNLMIQRTLKYGDNIDLSKATINEKPITIEMIQ